MNVKLRQRLRAPAEQNGQLACMHDKMGSLKQTN